MNMVAPDEAAASAAETVLYVPDEPTVSAPEGGEDAARTRRNRAKKERRIGRCIFV